MCLAQCKQIVVGLSNIFYNNKEQLTPDSLGSPMAILEITNQSVMVFLSYELQKDLARESIMQPMAVN